MLRLTIRTILTPKNRYSIFYIRENKQAKNENKSTCKKKAGVNSVKCYYYCYYNYIVVVVIIIIIIIILFFLFLSCLDSDALTFG